MTHDPTHNTQGVPDEGAEADTASGGAPEPSEGTDDETTDDDGTPVENPSGG